MTEKFTIGPAKREGVPVFIGIAGPSSSGKTYSALRVATGIQRVVGGDIAVIDTEGKRALHYAEDFKFQHIPFGGPFNALRYLEAIKFAAGKGMKTIIVDSMSHEHEGEGGHLAMHDAELDRLAGSDYAKRERVTFTAWAKPAAERRALLNGIQQMSVNTIFCFRAKEKIALVKNQQGKTVPVEMGWQPIAGSEFVYDMTALVVLPPRSGGVVDWKAEAIKNPKGLAGMFPETGPLDEATGERLARWGQGDSKPPAEKKKPPTAAEVVDGLITRIDAVGTADAVSAILTEEIVKKQILWLLEKNKPEHTRLFDHANARRLTLKNAPETVGGLL